MPRTGKVNLRSRPRGGPKSTAQNTRLPLVTPSPATSAAGVFRSPQAAAAPPARSLYIHVPFCAHKCHYCDFYSIVDPRDRQAAFLDRLLLELEALAPFAGPLATVFIGGGTPSLLRVNLWEQLLAGIRERFRLLPGADGGEFTVECNPETVTPDLAGVLAEGGVTRVSIGAQSFDPRHLKTLERWHDPRNVERALRLARDAGIRRQSLDLIFAIPGQSPGDWGDDLEAALDLGTEHVSCYCLTYEANTAMTVRLRRGEFAPAGEDLELEMLTRALRRLREAGLERYEVSNFARPGAECRHNLAYWRQEAWLAAGPAAAGHFAGHRWKNVPRLDEYLSVNDGGFAPTCEHEPPDARRALAEYLMTSLRTSEGADAAAALARASALSGDAADSLRGAVRAAAARGHLADSGARWILTDGGILLADGITGDLMGALDGAGRG